MLTTAAIALTLTAGIAEPCPMACTGETKAAPQTSLTTVAYTAKKNIVEVAIEAGSFSTLAAALEAADLVDALANGGPFTVFAPTDEAFSKLPTETVENLLKPENRDQLRAVLLYHVVAGKAKAEDVTGKNAWATLNGQRIEVSTRYNRVMIDKARVSQADIEASNGVIHVIDSVILPELRNIPEVAESAGSFATLLAAAEAAGLVETLVGPGPFTVFAPTDEAFAALGDTVQNLLQPENRNTLRSILLHHVVSGRVYADQAKELSEARTVNRSTLKIESRDGKVMVGGAEVVKADIEASNGVIHVIGSVLIPE